MPNHTEFFLPAVPSVITFSFPKRNKEKKRRTKKRERREKNERKAEKDDHEVSSHLLGLTLFNTILTSVNLRLSDHSNS